MALETNKCLLLPNQCPFQSATFVNFAPSKPPEASSAFRRKLTLLYLVSQSTMDSPLTASPWTNPNLFFKFAFPKLAPPVRPVSSQWHSHTCARAPISVWTACVSSPILIHSSQPWSEGQDHCQVLRIPQRNSLGLQVEGAAECTWQRWHSYRSWRKKLLPRSLDRHIDPSSLRIPSRSLS